MAFFTKYIRQVSFVICWTTIMVVHTLLVHLYSDLPLGISIIDSLVFNTLMAVLSYGIWLLTSFYDINTKKTGELIINHITAAAFSISLWIYLSSAILKHIFSDNSYYLSFIHDSVPFRAVSGMMLYAISTWIFYLLRILEKAQWQARQQEKISTLLRDAELKALRSQINPHFLFNSLNSIHSLTMIDPDKAGDMILKLSDLMRYSLSKQEQKVPFSEEIKQVNRYLDIEKIRFSERLSVEYEIANDIQTIPVPSMILQPLIENAVKYGIYGVENNVIIRLQAEKNQEFLSISLFNNYDPTIPVKHGTGTGLNNVRERLSAIYYRSDLLIIEKGDQLFKVKINIPLI